ncbi:hypothetical protein GCM10027084_11570 [Pseudoxanthomonas sangjuensis]
MQRLSRVSPIPWSDPTGTTAPPQAPFPGPAAFPRLAGLFICALFSCTHEKTPKIRGANLGPRTVLPDPAAPRRPLTQGASLQRASGDFVAVHVGIAPLMHHA